MWYSYLRYHHGRLFWFSLCTLMIFFSVYMGLRTAEAAT